MENFGIATYVGAEGTQRVGIVVDGNVYDADAALISIGQSSGFMAEGLAFALTNWDSVSTSVLSKLSECAAAIRRHHDSSLQPVSGALRVPYEPTRIFATASNFYEHAAEMGTKLAARSESSPYIFLKADSSITATKTAVVMPPRTVKLDWEVELAVVIGKGGRHISVEHAHEHIAGYTVINDISARDLSRRTDYPFSHDWFRGKSFDSFGPMGPWFVPRDCIVDAQNLRMQLTVNGEMMQDATTAGMIFNIAEQIAYLSSIVTLRGGDLIATGTPTGVGMGRGVYLKPGDVMVASIEHIGAVENHVISHATT